MAEHARLLAEWLGEGAGLRDFRKHTGWYLTGYPVGPQARRRLSGVSSLESSTTCWPRSTLGARRWCPAGCGPIAATRTGPGRSTSRTAGSTIPTISPRCRETPTPWSRGDDRQVDRTGPARPRLGVAAAAAAPALRRLDFTSVAPDIDERPQDGRNPCPYVERLAREKALAVTVDAGDVVVAADTTVALGAADPRQARGRRRRQAHAPDLSGRSHDVHTAVAVRVDGRVVSTVVTTRVSMVELSDDDVDWYVGTGEPLDKAGAYALQEGGGLLVERIEGSASNVVVCPWR